MIGRVFDLNRAPTDPKLLLDLVVGTPSIMGRMGVGIPNLHIQRTQIESLTGLTIVSKNC